MIVHLITRLVHGGAQLNTIFTAQHQARQGHDVILASGPETGPEGSLWDMARNSGLQVVTLPHLVRNPHPIKDARAFGEIVDLLRRTRPHMVHTHTSKAGLLGRLAARRTRVPLVIHTPHGHVFHSYFSSPKTSVFVRIEQALAPLTDRLVALTETEREEHLAKGVGRPEQWVIIPSGVDISRFNVLRQPEQRSALGLPVRERDYLVGCVARLAPVKGVLDLVRATALVAERAPDLHVVVAGDGPQRAEVEAEIHSHRLESRVSLLGTCFNVPEVLSAVDALAIPSHNEGMGRVAVEGMAAGLPIVATRVGGLPDLVLEGQTGLLVTPREPASLADGLFTLWRDRDSGLAMGDRARQRAGDYSLERMLDLLTMLYADLGVSAEVTHPLPV